MEKAVKIQGQNVVVIIEPDPTLADATMAADAIAALDTIHTVESTDNNIQVRDKLINFNRFSKQKGLLTGELTTLNSGSCSLWLMDEREL